MIKLIVATTGTALFFTSCSNQIPESRMITEQTLEKHRASQPWWRQLNDAALNQDISAALSNNPSLQSVALRVNQAEAVVASEKAATLPRINLGFGYQEGRRREVDFGPYNLTPWQSQAGLSWEIDLSGKFKASKNAAVESRNAAVLDTYAARLMLASRIANVRMNLVRLNADIKNTNAILASQRRTLKNYTDRSEAGIIPDSSVYGEQAKLERIARSKQDLQRLRELTIVQLRSLRGGSQPSNTSSALFPKPKRLISQKLDTLLASHPSILAAEARVRAALQLEQSAKLDLLPSFQINLLASGEQQSLVERFKIWTVQAGPSLNIPIYDPVRIAKLKYKKSQAKIESAKFKEMVLKVLEEIDSARINLASNRGQLETAKRETKALLQSKSNSKEQLNAGVISEGEYFRAEQRHLNAERNEASLQQRYLTAYFNLIKATGGGRVAN